mgnify:CR=1 FL=1
MESLRGVYEGLDFVVSSNVGGMDEKGKFKKSLDSSRTSTNAWCAAVLRHLPNMAVLRRGTTPRDVHAHCMARPPFTRIRGGWACACASSRHVHVHVHIGQLGLRAWHSYEQRPPRLSMRMHMHIRSLRVDPVRRAGATVHARRTRLCGGSSGG